MTDWDKNLQQTSLEHNQQKIKKNYQMIYHPPAIINDDVTKIQLIHWPTLRTRLLLVYSDLHWVPLSRLLLFVRYIYITIKHLQTSSTLCIGSLLVGCYSVSEIFNKQRKRKWVLGMTENCNRLWSFGLEE